jgi:hypothetical protein
MVPQGGIRQSSYRCHIIIFQHEQILTLLSSIILLRRGTLATSSDAPIMPIMTEITFILGCLIILNYIARSVLFQQNFCFCLYCALICCYGHGGK